MANRRINDQSSDIRDLQRRVAALERIDQSDAGGFTVFPSGTSDPIVTSANNGIYYNTVSNKYRKYENGSWSDLDT